MDYIFDNTFNMIVICFFGFISCFMSIRHYMYSSILGCPLLAVRDTTLVYFTFTNAVFSIFVYLSIIGLSLLSFWVNHTLPVALVVSIVFFFYVVINMHITFVKLLQKILIEDYLNDCYLSIEFNEDHKKRTWAGKKIPFLKFSFLNGEYDICSIKKEKSFDYFEDILSKVNHEKVVKVDLLKLIEVNTFAAAIVSNAFLTNGYTKEFFSSHVVYTKN